MKPLVQKTLILVSLATALSACNSYTDPMCNESNRVDVPGFAGTYKAYSYGQASVTHIGTGLYEVDHRNLKPTVSTCRILGDTYVEFQPYEQGYTKPFYSIARIDSEPESGWTLKGIVLATRDIDSKRLSWGPYSVKYSGGQPKNSDAPLIRNAKLPPETLLRFASLKRVDSLMGFIDSDITLRRVGTYPNPSLPFTPATRTSVSGSVFTKVSPTELKRLGVDPEKFGEAWQDPSRVIWSDVIRVGGEPSKMWRVEAAAYCNSIGASLPTNSTLEKLAEYLGRGTAGGYVPEILPGLDRSPIWSLELVGHSSFGLFTDSRSDGRLVHWSQFPIYFRCAR